MTDLTRRVSRRTRLEGEPRPIVVTLHPDGTIEFREARRRTGFRITLASVYRFAAAKAAEQLRAERKAARAMRKASK